MATGRRYMTCMQGVICSSQMNVICSLWERDMSVHTDVKTLETVFWQYSPPFKLTHTCVLSRARARREGRLLLVVIVVVERKVLWLYYNYLISILYLVYN